MISQVRLCGGTNIHVYHFMVVHLSPNTIFHSSNDITEMRRHRKMGHITIVGHSVGIVEARLKSMLGGEISDGQTAGQFCGQFFGRMSDAILI